MIDNIRFTEIKRGWRHDHGKGEKLRLYFSKDKDGKESVYLDAAVEEVLDSKNTTPIIIPLFFARVFWDDADKIMMIQPGNPRSEDVRKIILNAVFSSDATKQWKEEDIEALPKEKAAFSSDPIKQWEDEDIEALLKEKAPIEKSEIGYCVNGTWDSDQQQLTYDFKQRIPIKED